MNLPKIDVPFFEMDLISIDKPVTYRPFLVKEEKLMLMAIEGGEPGDILKTTKQILNNCVVDEDVDTNNLPIFDLMFALLRIRAKSVGEIVDVNIGHLEGKNSKGEECDGMHSAKVDVSTIKPTIDNKHSKYIRISDQISIEMKYPTIDLFSKISLAEETGQVEDLFMLMTECIHSIYSGDEVFNADDVSSKELNDFIGSFTSEQFSGFKEFFNTMPKLSHTIEWTCKKCGCDEKTELTGLADFFL